MQLCLTGSLSVCFGGSVPFPPTAIPSAGAAKGERILSERLLKYLVEHGLITSKQADQLRDEHHNSGRSICELLNESGAVGEEQLLEALSAVSRLPTVRLYEQDIPSDVRQLVRADLLRTHIVFPFAHDPEDPSTILVALSDPMNIRGRELVAIASKCRVRPYLATSSDILVSIDRYFGTEEMREAAELFTRDTEADLSVEDELIREDVNSSPVVMLVNSLIEQAARQRASDIHIEPEENGVRVRYRVDGVLFVAGNYDRRLLPAIIARVKILSGLDISEKRKPQDGRSTITVDGKEYDIRVSTLPTVYGEKCVMRLGLKKAVSQKFSLQALGFTPEEEEQFLHILRRPNGIVLVTGPTGSGKSRTLYTALNELNNLDVNIVTVEDPVEINLDGVNQVQVNPKAGLTFATALRSILRQDPDIIMIGEIRDGETASIAVQASITGHLVLSTLHTNDTASTITRLLDMGVESYLMADSLAGIVAKRLVRCLCPHCKRPHVLDQTELDFLQLTPEEAATATVCEPVGCQRCGGRGFYERTGVYEILEITPYMRNMIAARATTSELREAAIKEGMSTLHNSARRLVLEGQTTIPELLRISGESC